MKQKQKEQLENFYRQFCTEEFADNRMPIKFDIRCPENYNFGYDVVDAIAGFAPEQPAMVWCSGENGSAGQAKDTVKIFTYRDLMEKSNQTANMLAASGVRKGDRVLCVLKRHYQFWFLTIALCKLGAVLIPATNQLMVKDYVYRFEAANIKYVVATADGETAVHIEEAMKQYGGIAQRFLAGGGRDGWINFDEQMEQYPITMQRIDTHYTDDMLLYFTSGTTGYPKMVMHRHTYSLAHIPTAKYWQQLHPGSLHLTVSESGWGKCMWGKMYGQFLCGATILVYDFDRFHAGNLLQKIQDFHVTSFCAPPTIYRFFIKEGMEQFDLSGLEHVTIAGEALNPEVYNRFLEYTGLKLMEGFGQTESNLILGTFPDMEPKPGSMGKPSPLYHVEILDEDGQPVTPGEVGEICVRGERGKHLGLFKGYVDNEQETNAAWHDGWYHTGDTAWQDEDGYVWYVGRTDDVIKSSGYRIGPFEIESVLMEHPSVLECAVTGAKDPIRGIVVKATVVLTSAYKDRAGEDLAKELQNYVKQSTAPYKYPRIVEFVSELPKTISGKIRRIQIRGE